MIMPRKVMLLTGACVLAVAASAAKRTSEPTFVFLNHKASSFWSTATNSVVTLPIDYPAGVSTATLTVDGQGYSQTYANITDVSFELSLPQAGDPAHENVYNLTLTFGDGTVRTARLGVVQSLSVGRVGHTRCLSPSNQRAWTRVKGGRAVLPIPCGMTAFSVSINGEPIAADVGLDGAQGWYALGLDVGDEASLSMTADGLARSASLYGVPYGMIFRCR